MKIGVGVSSTSMSVLRVSRMSVLKTAVVGFNDLEVLDETEITTDGNARARLFVLVER